MLSYKLGYWWTDSVLKLHQSCSNRVGEQAFISELTQNSYFLGHWGAVGCGGYKARQARLLFYNRVEPIIIWPSRADIDGAISPYGGGGADLATCGVAPLQGAAGGYGIEIIIIRADIDDAIRPTGGGGLDRPTCGEAPLQGAARVYGVEPIIIRAYIDGAISSYGGGGADRPTGGEAPLQYRYLRTGVRASAGVLQVPAEHRPGSISELSLGGVRRHKRDQRRQHQAKDNA